MKIRLLAAVIVATLFLMGQCLVSQTGFCAEKSGTATNASDGLKSYDDKWAVVIGVDSYADPALDTVLPLDESAKRVYEALSKRGFANDHLRVMLNRDATRHAIKTSLSSSWLGSLSRNSDLAVVFIAAQCFPANDGKVYLMPYDTRLANFFNTTISFDEILSMLKSSVHAKDVVVVLQTSFSGAPEMMAGCKAMFGRYNVTLQGQDLPSNFTILVSSKAGQPTWGTYFSDNLAEDLALDKSETSLADLFAKVRNDTVYDTAKDCSGCKVQSPVLFSRTNPKSISLESIPTKPLNQFPEQISIYLKGEVVYSACQAVLDEYRHLRSEQEGWAGSPLPVRQLEMHRPDVEISKELQFKIDSTVASAQSYLMENPASAAVHYMLGRLLQIKKDFKGSLVQYKEAVRLKPEEPSYHSWLARGLERQGESGALEEWQAVYKLNKKSLSAIENLAGRAVAQGDLVRALDLYNEALALYPGDAVLHIRLSDVLRKEGKLKLAIDQAQEAVFLDENSFDALVNLGVLFLANKDEKSAHAAFRQALQSGHPQPEAYYVLAEQLEKTNDPEGAIEAWTRFVDGSNKGDKRLADAKKRLDELKRSSQ